MKTFVIDASVVVKWIFPEKEVEHHASQAINLLHAIKRNTIKILQPPHWLAEVSSVITRLQPGIASDAIGLLYGLDFSVVNEMEIYQLASQLSKKLEHHLFDTLYHAVALSNDAIFITADEQYYKKAAKLGFINRLTDFNAYD